jgi:hypothetical protein
MNDNIKLLEMASKKAATDRDFIAYFLSNYIQIEHTSEDVVMTSLNCNVENYYRLGLCRAPNITDENYLDRLNNICVYIGISTLELNKIIKRVYSILQLREVTTTNENSLLMAARDKKKKGK